MTVDNLKVTSNFTGSFESIISVGAIAGEFNGGEIINCTVKNSSIDTSKIKSETFVGGFAGYSNYGLIENCKFGEVEKESATSVYGNDFVGGFVGFSSTGTINDCINYGTVKCGYAEDIIPFVGGIAGEQSGGAKIVNSCNVGIIKYAGDKNSDKNFQPRMGQLLGTNASGSVYNTLFTSNIGTVSSCQGTVDKGNLRSVGGFLGIGATNQAKYVSSGCVGEE